LLNARRDEIADGFEGSVLKVEIDWD
jgi:hypothetical protein